jgi:four helix bundle protein
MDEHEGFIFEKLKVYQKALDLSVYAIKIASKFEYKYSRIRDQFIGAIISIPLNIAEGNGRGSKKEKINFYKIARSSSFECIAIVSICRDIELFDNDTATQIRNEIRIISMMLSGLIKYNLDRQP